MKTNFKKYSKQTSIYIIEILFVLFFLNIIVFYIEHGNLSIKITRNTFGYELISKNIAFYAIYQLMVFAILTLIDSSKKDSVLMLKVFYEKLELLLQYNQDTNVLIETYRNNITDRLMLDEKYKKEFDQIYILNTKFINKKLLKEQYELQVKAKKIDYAFLYEYYSLSWRLSFLLRIYFK
ncbi:hypothetical protein ACIQXW_08300 [Lysinibacillus sp. NPDC097162]|uniref:hypothetical protein n=1 Tax=Lysinibacillus sp. NPDC097162 TaxID=3364140 RepID=UPI0038144607